MTCRLLFLFFVVASLIVPFSASAHDTFSFETATLVDLNEELAEQFPSVVPGFFYPLQRLAEEVQMLFTFGRREKAEYSITLVRLRFGEASALIERLADRPLDGFLSEAGRLQTSLVLAEQNGNMEMETAERAWLVLFGAVVRLDLYESSLALNFSAEKEAPLAALAEIVAAQNRTAPADERKRLDGKLRDVIAGSKLASIDIMESQLASHLNEYQNILLEANGQLGGQKLEVAVRRTKTMAEAVVYIERFMDERDGTAVRDGLVLLKGLQLELEQLKKSALEKAQRLVWCVQISTSSRNPATGECKEFPTPCDIPDGWLAGACA